MPGGGRVTIEVGIPSELDAVATDLVSIRVTDEGSGMSAETVSRAFEPFFTTKAIGHGTGLGLSQVYGFARRSSGTADIRSALGAGSTVTIVLPRRHGPATSPTRATAVQVERSAGETILVVDDDPLVRTIVSEGLEDLGYVVLQAGNGREGLGLLRSDARIDLLVSDVMMPLMDGPTMIRLARTSRPAMPILIMTGYSSNLLAEGDLLDDRMDVVMKPFAIADLCVRIQAALA